MGFSFDDIKSLSPEAQRQITAHLLGQGKKPEKSSKYHNIKMEVNGIKFDSAKEAKKYSELMLLLETGEIRNLQLQRQYTLQEGYVTPQGERVKPIKYIADFAYERSAGKDTYGYEIWLPVTLDTKGVKTDVYRMKAKMFLAKYGYPITEV